MAFRVNETNGIKVYELSAGRTMPEWMAEKRNRSLRKDEEYRQRMELIQDFHFPGACQRIRMSPDGQYVIATGTYPPTIRVFEVNELSMKFERRTDCEIVQFCCLTEDFGKLAFLQADRTVELHAPYGKHYKTRIPIFGRDMIYHPHASTIYVGGAGDKLYRLNLEDGRFASPVDLGAVGVNALDYCASTQLIAAGTETGDLSIIDPRIAEAVGSIRAHPDSQVTALRMHANGYSVMTGSEDAEVHIYDLRSSRPVMTKSHPYGFPIVDCRFHNGAGDEPLAISVDKRVIKIWNERSGAAVANVESEADLHEICVPQLLNSGGATLDSGLLFAAAETEKVGSYYIPHLGPTPKWASFLDSITEELEENNETAIYEDYKFVTRDELRRLGLDHLRGTQMLKAYMHGFFIDSKLYARVRAVADPEEFTKWRKARYVAAVLLKGDFTLDRITKKIHAQRGSRIAASKPKQPSAPVSAAVAADDRFAKLFTEDSFRIDQESEEFALRNPSGKREAVPSSDEEEIDDAPTRGTIQSASRAALMLNSSDRPRPSATRKSAKNVPLQQRLEESSK